jgi:malonate-semialdehyde dehydrogenase (acetylating) / methylmalonate-semialdehyde dehydrogenase
LLTEAGLPPGVFNVVKGDKEAVGAVLHHPQGRGGQLCRLDADCPLHLPDRRRERQARAGLGRPTKNHMVVMPDADLDQVTDALMGAAYG